MNTSLKKDLEIFITLQIILILSYYILSIRLLYYLLLENFLREIIIISSYKKIIILNIYLEKQRVREMNIKLKGFLN